jgi:hypothetical protein
MPVDNVKYSKFLCKILTFLLYRLIICDFNFISSNNGTDNKNETAIKFNMIIIKYLTISSEQFEIDAKFQTTLPFESKEAKVKQKINI